MISKQIILGSVLLIGGAVTIFAMSQNNEPANSAAQPQTTATTNDSEVARPVAVPLTTDVVTEEKLLAQKQKEREAYNQQMAKEADALLDEQERARMLALDKAKQEANPSSTQISADNASKSELIAVPTVQTRPEAVEAARVAQEKKLAEQKAAQEKAAQERLIAEQKAKETAKAQPSEKPAETKPTTAQTQPKAAAPKDGHTVAAGDTLIGLSRKYGVPVSAIAAVNNMGRNDALVLGRTVKIPTAAQVARLEREGQTAQNKTQTQNQTAQKTNAKTDDKKPASNANSGYVYSVQVAISPDKAKVDEMVKKYRAAGYQVSTSQTSRGTRVLIGSANSYDEANVIKQKLAKDSRVDASGAWVKKLER